MSITTSTAWFDQSANANKLRQSYLKGFLDISGGGVYVRADNSLNFYTAGSETVPKFSMNAEKITVVSDASNNGKTAGDNVSFSTRKLAFLWDLSENVQKVFTDIRSVINGSTTAAATSTTQLAVVADAKIGGNLQVGGNVYIDQNLAVSGNVSVGQNLSVKGNAMFGGNIEVAGSEVINMNLYVKGDTFLSGRLFVTGDCSFHNNIAVYGNTTTVGSVIAGADLSASGRLFLTKEAVMKSTLSVGGAATVTGASTLKSTVDITGATKLKSTLSAAAAVTFADTLDVTGATTFASTLSAGDAVTFASTLDVTAATTLASTLSVGYATTLASTLSVGDNITMADGKTFQTGNLQIYSSSSANDPNIIKCTSGNLAISAGTGKKVHITSDLVVDGSFTFTGSLTQTNVNINVTEQLDICANAITPLLVNQLGDKTNYDIARFDNTAGSVFVVGKNNTIAINRAGDATVGYHFDLSGKSLFSDDVTMQSKLSVTAATILSSSLSVGGISIMKSTLSVGAATVMNSTLSVGNDVTLNTKLSVGGEATFTSLAKFNAGIALATGYYLDQSSDW